MSEQTMARPGAGADAIGDGGPASQPRRSGSPGPGGRSAQPDPGAPATPPVPPTPARPVVSIALVMFVPAVVLVLDGNLSVQTALMRFVAALLVSWVAARLVWATVQSARAAGAGPVPRPARTARARPARAEPGRAGRPPAQRPPAGPAT